MMTPLSGPEAKAREKIDAQLEQSGWIVQDRDEADVYAGQGVAIREFGLQEGYGQADYLLFVDQQAVGVLEAKKDGYPPLRGGERGLWPDTRGD